MEPSQQWQRGEFRINSDKSELDLAVTHAFLATTSWAQGISLTTVQQSIDNSLCFGLYHQRQQIGFARLVTDYSTFGYLCDVFVIPEFTRQGLAKWLMACMLEHPVLQRLRRIMLVTSSAPGLYQQVGYQPVNKQDFVWQIARPDIYQQQ
ncbi:MULTISPECIES: GNAT family N-acetyltransferase [Serratia]|uniref:GNAT family N-acetyltransferase n=1 Tax=Serratia fonticola TaxID=47917 RepID=A0AAJ1YHD2_SERFO|nr:MULTISPECIES: GNAT family N-acetyltransferase [Serratia]MDQ7207493.1 GNAT family N-acetyltransferase [Serratia fonticola]MDQ9128255.1 GNAT family N-acetyltransferase [Serratia fonticola]OKP26898.1 N-acetyltransferase [Serratia fonticola]HBE9077727.1 GNAT family N-acetyltransferase [Serratia fonticola]HBE9088298.1 GNAT family N-acetyltransferase [Serratia fonticola]